MFQNCGPHVIQKDWMTEQLSRTSFSLRRDEDPLIQEGEERWKETDE